MAALSAPRVTPKYGPAKVVPILIDLPVADNVKIYPGAAIVISGGYAAPASTATSLVSVGVYEGGDILDNTGTGHAAGAFRVPVTQGVFGFANSASGDLIAQANVGADCFWVNDQTVALTSNSNARSRAGKVIGFQNADASGYVLVQLAIGL
jgi:hypothetical protein